MFGEWAANTLDSLTRSLQFVPKEILAALQTMAVETVVRTQRHRLDADNYSSCRVVGPGKDFVAIWILGMSSAAGCHHDVTRYPSYLFVTTNGIVI